MHRSAKIVSQDASAASELIANWAETKKRYISLDKGFWRVYADALSNAYYIRLPEIYESLWNIAKAEGTGAVPAAQILLKRFDPDYTKEGPAPVDSEVARKLVGLLKELRKEGKEVDIEASEGGDDKGDVGGGFPTVEGSETGPST